MWGFTLKSREELLSHYTTCYQDWSHAPQGRMPKTFLNCYIRKQCYIMPYFKILDLLRRGCWVTVRSPMGLKYFVSPVGWQRKSPFQVHSHKNPSKPWINCAIAFQLYCTCGTSHSDIQTQSRRLPLVSPDPVKLFRTDTLLF